MNRHYRKYEPLSSRLRRMSAYPFVAPSALPLLLAAFAAVSTLFRWDYDAPASLAILVAPALILSAVFYTGYRWARGEASWWAGLLAFLGVVVVVAFFSFVLSIKLQSF